MESDTPQQPISPFKIVEEVDIFEGAPVAPGGVTDVLTGGTEEPPAAGLPLRQATPTAPRSTVAGGPAPSACPTPVAEKTFPDPEAATRSRDRRVPVLSRAQKRDVKVHEREIFLLTPARYEVLVWLERCGYLTYALLSMLIGEKPNALRNRVTGLVSAGYVTASARAIDRQKVYMLTPAGAALIYSRVARPTEVFWDVWIRHAAEVGLIADLHAGLDDSEELVTAREIHAGVAVRRHTLADWFRVPLTASAADRAPTASVMPAFAVVVADAETPARHSTAHVYVETATELGARTLLCSYKAVPDIDRLVIHGRDMKVRGVFRAAAREEGLEYFAEVVELKPRVTEA